MTTKGPLRLMVFAQVLDALTLAVFYLFVGPGAFREVNPAVIAILAAAGVGGVVAVKILLASYVMWKVPRPYKPSRFRFVRWLYPRIVGPTIAFIIVEGCVGAGFNLSATILGLAMKGAA